MKIILSILIVIILICVVILVLHSAYTGGVAVDDQTIEICREYASWDHEKEIIFKTSEERFKWLGKEFVDNYDWFTSCINHIKYPVAL